MRVTFLEFLGVEEAVLVEALAEVDLLVAAGLAAELEEAAVGLGGTHDVAAARAEVDAEDGGGLRVVAAHG